VLLADCVCASSIQSFNLFAICSLQRAKDSNITGLKLIGGVRRNSAEEDVVVFKQYSIISSDSCVPKPLEIRIRGF
jgi:hypothetical protein